MKKLLTLLMILYSTSCFASIADQLISLNNAKLAIKAALVSYGITPGDVLADYDDKVALIPVASGGVVFAGGKAAEALDIGDIVTIRRDTTIPADGIYLVDKHTNPMAVNFADTTLLFGYCTSAAALDQQVSVQTSWWRSSVNWTPAQYFTFANNTISNYNVASGGTSVNIPPYIGTSKVTTISGAAFSAKHITSVVLPPTLTTINADSFYFSNLGSITFPPSVATISARAFSNAGLTGTVVIPNTVISLGTQNTFRRVAGDYPNVYTSITFGNGITTIPSYCCRDVTTLTSVTIGSSVTTIAQEAFRACAMTEIVLPNSLTAININAFQTVPLAKITIGSGVTIEATSTTMGSNLGFQAAYTTGGAGVYNFTGGNWVKE